MTWLITGGAGYIGSHVVHEFLSDGQDVVVYDSLINGSISRVPKNVVFIQGDIRDTAMLRKTLQEKSITGIIHLAALKSVSESVIFPKLYKEVNEKATKSIIEIAESLGIINFIFSSTAAVYGNPQDGFVTELADTSPISPYGASKLAAEEYLSQKITTGKLEGTSLRFFNVIGAANSMLADSSGSNLLPILVDKISRGITPEIFGTDYPTPDGTCIRDYVDVKDIARAHLIAAKRAHLLPSKINVGTGTGRSVREVINLVAIAMKVKVEPLELPRREGDAPMLVANVDLARNALQFEADISFEESISSLCR